MSSIEEKKENLIKLFNTASLSIERFVPLEENKVKLYCCGITVYSTPHLGNYKTAINWDVLVRTLRVAGYDVEFVQNWTDVGHIVGDADEGRDKMDIAVEREHKTAREIADHYINIALKDYKQLNILLPDVMPKATDHIDEMQKIISALLEKGYAYIASNGNVYYDTAAFPDYGKMAHLNIEGLRHGARVEEDPFKKNRADFVLWFVKSKFGEQEQRWTSPWGTGYPGWHIECSAMSIKYLGDKIDIHCGGEDHIKVHHTNEIAQSEGYLGHKWVNYWLHTKFLNMQGKKMSKSQGEILTPMYIQKEYGVNPLAFRHFVLGASYRKPLTFSKEAVLSSNSYLEKLYRKFDGYKKSFSETSGSEELSSKDNEILNTFYECLFNDMGTAQSLAIFNAVLKSAEIPNSSKYLLIKKMDEVLGLLPAS